MFICFFITKISGKSQIIAQYNKQIMLKFLPNRKGERNFKNNWK